MHLLAPTPELWTQVLKHRTQILYAGVGMTLSFQKGELQPPQQGENCRN